MRHLKSLTLTLSLFTFVLAGCGAIDIHSLLGGGEEPFSSDQATLLDFSFEAEFMTTSSWNFESQAEEQLLYTVGHLNWDNSVSRLDKVDITELDSQNMGNGFYKVTYKATMPVGWGSKTNLPTSYDFELPHRVDNVGMSDFSNRYKGECVDFSAHDVDAGSMWYYYRPQRSSCSLRDEDVIRFTASVTVSEENTKSKYPEYHKVWEDNALTVVAIYGKYEGGATSNGDAGISAYNRFTRSIRDELGSGVVTVPANVPSSPGVNMPDITFTKTLTDGRQVEVVALLVDNVRTAGSTFNNRYASVSADADLIIYAGHAGLGSNIRALAQKGEFKPDKFQMFFMNGCDTFAYVDDALATKKMQLNPQDDPNGTKYLDMITNLMPSYFHSMANASMELIEGLLNVDNPETYDEMFAGIDRAEVVVVVGEEDNVYHPGWTGGGDWDGMNESGMVQRDDIQRWNTGSLSAGSYRFVLSHDANNPGGDADLYVRVGAAPTTSAWDCRPYESGSNETCNIELTSDAEIHVAVIGYAGLDSYFVLTGERLGGGGGGGGTTWTGMSETGSVDQGADVRFDTETLAAGSYTFELNHDANNPGGDADLYVRVGAAPTTGSYDCRPWLNGSVETCTISVTSPAKVHVMVAGYATGLSYFTLTGAQN